MGVLVMLKNKKAYKELVLRRDVCRLVYELRQYRYTTVKLHPTVVHSNYNCKHFICEYGDFTKKLTDIMVRARVLKGNPNFLQDYQDSLGHRCIKLYEESTDEEKKQISNIQSEINTITYLCHDSKFLSIELMELYRTLSEKMCPIERSTLESAITTLLSDYAVYDAKSAERAYLMTVSAEEDDDKMAHFNNWYGIYFLDKEISIEDLKTDFDELFEFVTNGNKENRIRLKKYIGPYLVRKTPLDENQLVYMIENDRDILNRVMTYFKLSLPFNLNEYLEALFIEAQSGEARINHHPASPFAKEKITAKDIGDFLAKNIYDIQQLYKGTGLEMVADIAKKSALLPDGIDIVVALEKSLKRSPNNDIHIKLMTDTFLSECAALIDTRERLTFTMKQIKDKKAHQDN